MKNLHVFQTEKVRIDATIIGHCVDADNGRLLIIANDFRIYEVQECHLNEARLVDHDLDCKTLGLPANIIPDDIVLSEFVVESGSILLALKCGKFIQIGVSSFSPPSSCIHEHNKYLSSVKLSPDQDLIALADVENEVYILSSDCSVICTSNALLENESVNKPVGVGWGSKETQFFGLDGRPSKEKQAQDKINIDEAELNDIAKIESSDIYRRFRAKLERSTVLDWRGDGQYLATLTYIPENEKHYLKVWNRNLQLQYMSEQLVTMERGLLSWIPNGQYVCCAQRRDNRINEVAMFEKNGMIHQRVSLPTFMPHLYIKNLLWSPDSKVLAIIVTQFSTASGSEATLKHMLLLFTMQNFHYYLKYSQDLNCCADHFTIRWNPIHHNILYVSSTEGKCFEYNCTLAVDQCSDESTVVVVDSQSLLVTPFSICNIPPPMSAFKMEFNTIITRFIKNSERLDKSFVLTCDNRLYYNSNLSDNKTAPAISTCLDVPKIRSYVDNLGKFSWVEFPNGQDYQNLSPVSQTSLLATLQRESHCDLELVKIVEDQIEKIVVKSFQDRQIVSIVTNSYQAQANKVLLLFDDSTCAQLDLTTSELKTKFVIKATNERLSIKEAEFVEEHDAVFSLAMDATLRINERTIVPNSCTSFKISESFLVYTTTENMINILPLDRLASNDLQDDQGAWNQPVENGGTLILVCEYDSKVILQMPRGNLEILHPRIMILLRIINHIDSSDYVSAMKLARRYRVDLNFICDYMLARDESKFYEQGLNAFANAIAIHDPSLLNLFIAELTREDTMLTRYRSAMNYLPASVNIEFGVENKLGVETINKICSTIKLPSDDRYLQPRLLCLLKQEPRKTGEALTIIHSLPTKDEKDAALKFILYFVSIEQLFLDSISTYNTDIALMVASASSKDPKEYLALLDSFNAIADTNMRRYTMDMHIKDYERAFTNMLAHLHDSSDKSATKTQLLELVVSKRIYKHAIKACFDSFVDFVQLTGGQCGVNPTFSELCVEIWTRYGDYLLEKRYYLEAGLAYSKSMATNCLSEESRDKTLDNVIKCFLLANEWQRCLAAVERSKVGADKREEALRRISRALNAQNDPIESVLVAQLVKDDDRAFQLLNAGRWHLAEAIVTEGSRSRLHDEIDQTLGSGLKSFKMELSVEITDARGHFDRFKELVLTPGPVIEHHGHGECINADSLSTVDGSETTSISLSASTQSRGKVARSGAPSIKTRSSSKSSKSQANKKKKIQLKKGSRHEDMALVAELQTFIKNQRTRQDSSIDLLAFQVEFNSSSHVPAAKELNKLLEERHELACDILNALWPKSDLEDNVYSVYKRFSRLFAAGECLDNEEAGLLMRPEFPTTMRLFEL